MGIILTLIASLLMFTFSPFLILYGLFIAPSWKSINDHFWRMAVSIDQMGNVIGAPFFNSVAIMECGFQFGNEDETISSVLGRNYQAGTLKLLGRSMRYYLDKIQTNHCINSIGK